VKTPTPDREVRDARARAAAAGVRARTAGRVALKPARVALRPAVSTARGLAEILRYWRAERSTLRQGMVSLSISALGNIPTGLALGAMQHRLEALPGLFLLVPAAIGMRGNIFGALGSRLGTSMHAGLLKFTRDRHGRLAQNIWATTLLTFITSLFLAVAARAVTAATGLPTVSVWDFLVISVLGGVFSSAFVLVLTVGLAKLGSQREWDLDSVAAPLVTFMGDLITMPSLFLASYVAARRGVTLSVGAACAVVCLAAVVSALRTELPIARRIVRESMLTLALAGTVDLIAGAVLEHRKDRFFTFAALLVMLPAFLENAGALGGIVSSRLASKLHLGAIRPRWVPDRLAALDISLAAPWSILNFGATGMTAHFVARALGERTPGLAMMVAIALIAGTFATIGAALVAYGTAVATFHFNLDPDNHGIAAVTSSMDLVGVVCLVATVALLGVK
jgi:mgtE-like transporter